METAKLLETGFSTADAEYPEIMQVNGELTIRFTDWQERLVEIRFEDAIAFKWQIAEILLDGERNDCSYEVLNSAWIEAHKNHEDLEEDDKYKHFRFNFNAMGQFEVIALGFTPET